MKVFQVLGWPLTTGGHIASTYALAREMQQKGSVIYISAPWGPMAESFISAGLHFIPCKTLLHGSPLHLLAFPRLALAAKQCGAQLIHAMDYKSLYPAYLAASFLGIPLFFTKAGGVVPSYRIPKMTKVIVFSEELQRGMGEQYSDFSGRIELIKERIDTHLFSSGGPLVLSGGYPLRLFMAMRFEESKRAWLEAVMFGMKKLTERGLAFNLTFAGDGPLRNEFEAAATDIGRAHFGVDFHFLGAVTNPTDMAKLYRAADVVIGHGRGVLEAMACAKPVIVLSPGTGATLVEPGIVGAICEYNFSGRHIRAYPEAVGDLADIIFMLGENAEKRRELGKFSHYYVESEYSIEVGGSKLAGLYAKAIDDQLVDTFPSALAWFLRTAAVRCFF